MRTCIQTEARPTCVNGVFGELLQGVFENDEYFLVTNPVSVFSIAQVIGPFDSDRILLSDPLKTKSQQLADHMFKKYSLTHGVVVHVDTRFPIGKGLGSSSSDLFALGKSISDYYELYLNTEDLEMLIREIEPTDGVIYNGIVSYFYRRVELYERLGILQSAKIVGIDEGGVCDTLSFNEIAKDFSTREKQRYRELYDLLKRAIEKNSIAQVGRISTESARLNQRYNPKVYFDEFLDIATKLDLPGIICAHSGTYLGFLLDVECSSFEWKQKELKAFLREVDRDYCDFYPHYA